MNNNQIRLEDGENIPDHLYEEIMNTSEEMFLSLQPIFDKHSDNINIAALTILMSYSLCEIIHPEDLIKTTKLTAFAIYTNVEKHLKSHPLK